MKIYTKTGDDGTTGLFGGGRVPKFHPRVESYGDLDELNSHVGLARAHLQREAVDRPAEPEISAQLAAFDDQLAQIQSDLLTLGAQLASARQPKVQIDAKDVERLEGWIDASEAQLEPLTRFILPGGSVAAAELHLCRTVCRRAERRAQLLQAELKTVLDADPLDDTALVYLNRLSDLFFSWGRLANRWLGVPDVLWEPGGSR